MKNKNTPQLATFGSGCFWGSQAVFSELKGVRKVTAAYCTAVINPKLEKLRNLEFGN